MTQPGPEYPAAAQTAAPEAPWGAPQDAPLVQPEKKGNAKKWASLAGAVVVAGIGGAYTLTGGFGIGDPKVNDCLHMKSETDFETVACDDADADAKVVGIEDEKQTEDEFTNDPTFCESFPTAEGAVWYQTGMITEKGTVYCVASA